MSSVNARPLRWQLFWGLFCCDISGIFLNVQKFVQNSLSNPDDLQIAFRLGNETILTAAKVALYLEPLTGDQDGCPFTAHEDGDMPTTVWTGDLRECRRWSVIMEDRIDMVRMLTLSIKVQIFNQFQIVHCNCHLVLVST